MRTLVPSAPGILRVSPRILTARRVISAAARRVKVNRRIRCGSVPLRTRRATRWASVLVLPVPAPATIKSGPDDRRSLMPYSTATRCLSFRSTQRICADEHSDTSAFGKLPSSGQCQLAGGLPVSVVSCQSRSESWQSQLSVVSWATSG
jgi:hypothetical protein